MMPENEAVGSVPLKLTNDKYEWKAACSGEKGRLATWVQMLLLSLGILNVSRAFKV